MAIQQHQEESSFVSDTDNSSSPEFENEEVNAYCQCSDSENCKCGCSSSESAFSSDNDIAKEFSGKLKVLMAQTDEEEEIFFSQI